MPRLLGIGEVLASHAGVCVPDVLGLLSERAALLGLRRGGDVSAGGSTRLLRSADGWLAVTLARPEDNDFVPAWLECDADPDGPWAVIANEVCARRSDELVERATLLGLPVAALPQTPVPPPAAGPPFEALPVGAAALGESNRHTEPFTVVELGSLWAAPLCGRLLRGAGGRVVKVESRSRPDGARRHPAFYRRLNEGCSGDAWTGRGRSHSAPPCSA